MQHADGYSFLSMTAQWKSGTSFVLATVGAAVGLGNIWRFSYVAGENGGAAFLLIYLFFVLIIGLPLVIAELALGRNSRGDAVSALDVQEAARLLAKVGLDRRDQRRADRELLRGHRRLGAQVSVRRTDGPAMGISRARIWTVFRVLHSGRA
jgi:hypothetical protein